MIRARAHIEDMEKGNRQAIIIDELPYQVNKANLLMQHRRAGAREAARWHRRNPRRIRQVRHARGDRIKRGEVAEVVLNNLYKLTQMQDSFGMNMVALVDGQPRAAESASRCSKRSCGIAAKSSRAAPYSSCAKRASAATSSKVSRSRCRTSTR